MADRQQPQAVQVIPQHRYDQGGYRGGATGGYGGGHQLGKGQGGPSASKILAVVTLLPVGGGLLALAGITLVGTLIGLAIATPLFIIFSPVIVPAALVVGLAVAAFLTSGAFGLTGLTSLSWVLNWVREVTRTMPETVDQAKKRMQDAVGFVGQKTKEVGQDIQRKAQYEGKHEGK